MVAGSFLMSLPFMDGVVLSDDEQLYKNSIEAPWYDAKPKY